MACGKEHPEASEPMTRAMMCLPFMNTVYQSKCRFSSLSMVGTWLRRMPYCRVGCFQSVVVRNWCRMVRSSSLQELQVTVPSCFLTIRYRLFMPFCAAMSPVFFFEQKEHRSRVSSERCRPYVLAAGCICSTSCWHSFHRDALTMLLY